MNEPAANPTPSGNVPASTRPSSAPTTRAEGQRRAEAVHDFAAKLRQPSLWPHVVDYLKWQRALRAAVAEGRSLPQTPALVPLSINLDLTTACNYACDHCIDWDILNQPTKHLEQELVDSIRLMAARGLKSIILIGGGEPTLYPGFVSFVRMAKELGLQIAVVSNGSRNEKILEIAPYLDERDWVRLSLDSGTNATFQRMHNPSKKSLTLDEICAWIQKIREVNPKPTLGFSFIITWRGAQRDDVKVVENLDEIVLATERARNAGFSYISFKPFLERSDKGSEVMDPEHAEEELAGVLRRIRVLVDEAKKLEKPGFRVLESTNLRLLMENRWREYTNQPHVCHFQALRQVLSPIGTYNCPAYRGVGYAKVGEKDAYKDEASLARTSSATEGLLRHFDAAQECREVTCLYNGANWWLERLIESGTDLDTVELAEERRDWFL